MAAMTAEKQQNPQPELQTENKDRPAENQIDLANDIETGTNENWNNRRDFRRKFSRTVPYETSIDGGDDGDGVRHDVSRLCYFPVA